MPKPELLRRSLTRATRAFLAEHADRVDELLAPGLAELREELVAANDPRCRALVRYYDRADVAWEKFLWAAIGRHWIKANFPMDVAIEQAEQDLLALGNILETVVVLEELAVEDDLVAGRRVRINLERLLARAHRRPDAPIDPEPTDEVPHVTPMMPMDPMLCGGPEDTTNIEPDYMKRPALVAPAASVKFEGATLRSSASSKTEGRSSVSARPTSRKESVRRPSGRRPAGASAFRNGMQGPTGSPAPRPLKKLPS